MVVIKEITMSDKTKDIKTDLKEDLIIVIEVRVEDLIDRTKEVILEMIREKKTIKGFLLVI